jgi:hypothetical protein
MTAAEHLNAAATGALPLFRARAVLDSVEWVLERPPAARARCVHAAAGAAVAAVAPPAWFVPLSMCGFAPTVCSGVEAARGLLATVAVNCVAMGVLLSRVAVDALMAHVISADCVVVLYATGPVVDLICVRASAALLCSAR